MIQLKQILPIIILLILCMNVPFAYSDNITNITVNNTNNTYNNTTTLEPQPGDTIYLSTSGNDNNTGENWNNSVKTLETALTLSTNNGTIIIGEGTYTQSTIIQQDINIISDKGPTKTIFTNQGLSESTIYSEQNNNINIEGISFTNCSANFGSGIYNNNYGTLTCKNCIFNNCTARFRGGAIINNGITNCNNCLFNNCQAISGGAIENNGEFYINNCQFTNNNATYGGTILNMVTLQATNSTFTNNIAETGGVIYNSNPQCYGTHTIHTLFNYCDFNYNTAKQANIAYTDNCNYSAITFNYSYLNPDNTNNFIGLITNLNQIIPLIPINNTLINTNTIPLAATTELLNPINNPYLPTLTPTNKTNNTPEPSNTENSNTLPLASLALASISLITTLALLLKPHLTPTQKEYTDNRVSQQLVENSIITYNMLKTIKFESGNIQKDKELNDLVEKIRSNPNCCPCCTSVLYMLTLLQGKPNALNDIEKVIIPLEFLLGPLINLYNLIKNRLKR